MADFMLSLISICISYSVYCRIDLENAMPMNYFQVSVVVIHHLPDL